jgi:hypothetical protein
MLARNHGTSHLKDDLDPQAERQPCPLAETLTGVPAVFVLGFPASCRPVPRGAAGGGAQSFDLLFDGLEMRPAGNGCTAAQRSKRHSAAATSNLRRSRIANPCCIEEIVTI